MSHPCKPCPTPASVSGLRFAAAADLRVDAFVMNILLKNFFFLKQVHR